MLNEGTTRKRRNNQTNLNKTKTKTKIYKAIGTTEKRRKPSKEGRHAKWADPL
jgi:hypothetical protein